MLYSSFGSFSHFAIDSPWMGVFHHISDTLDCDICRLFFSCSVFCVFCFGSVSSCSKLCAFFIFVDRIYLWKLNCRVFCISCCGSRCVFCCDVSCSCMSGVSSVGSVIFGMFCCCCYWSSGEGVAKHSYHLWKYLQFLHMYKLYYMEAPIYFLFWWGEPI